MNKKIVGLFMIGIMAIAAIFVATAKDQTNQANDQADIQDIPPTISGNPTYQYVAKFACGLVQPNTINSYVSPGDYRTVINIHNSQTSNISIKKKIVIASAEEPRNPIAPIWSRDGYRDLQSDYAFRMDCPDIYKIANVASGTFIEGFVVLFPSPSRQIDVTALYTVGSPLATTGGSIVAMDIETIRPKISVPATTTSYVDSPP